MASPFEDRVTISTPEGVAVDLVLAGLGSRFVARLLDTFLQGAFILAWYLLLVVSDGAALLSAVGSIGIFLGWFAYDVVFEVFASGRTPGKRWTGLRVVQLSGGPVGWGSSSVRNLVRLLDFLPGLYLVGSLSVVLSNRGQRVGDLVAGTLVVRERRSAPVSLDDLRTRPVGGPPPGVIDGWDVSAISADEVAVVRQFLQRRATLPPDARRRLADELAGKLGPRIAGNETALPPEPFLEALVAAKDARRA
jgi:uncharacterized RDD family membrane protein YckC